MDRYSRSFRLQVAKEAAKPENKKNIRRLISYYKDHIDAHKNITVINKEATYEEIVAGNYDVCIAATGGVSRKIKAINIDSQMVVNAMDYLGGEKVDGNTVVVMGVNIYFARLSSICFVCMPQNKAIHLQKLSHSAAKCSAAPRWTSEMG